MCEIARHMLTGDVPSAASSRDHLLERRGISNVLITGAISRSSHLAQLSSTYLKTAVKMLSVSAKLRTFSRDKD